MSKKFNKSEREILDFLNITHNNYMQRRNKRYFLRELDGYQVITNNKTVFDKRISFHYTKNKDER